MPPPEIADDLLPQRALVGQELRVEGASALEGVLESMRRQKE